MLGLVPCRKDGGNAVADVPLDRSQPSRVGHLPREAAGGERARRESRLTDTEDEIMKTLNMRMIVLVCTVCLFSGVARVARGQQQDSPPWGGRGEKPPRPPSAGELASNLIAKCDANGDSRLNADELTNALTEMRKQRPPARRRESDSNTSSPAETASEQAVKWIEKFAADKTGLTFAELQKALESDRPPRHSQGGPAMGGPTPGE